MAIFEEPLAAHNQYGEPVLVLAIDHVVTRSEANPALDRVYGAATVCNIHGAVQVVDVEALVVDWRYVEAQESWYDLADIRVGDEAAKEPVDEDS